MDERRRCRWPIGARSDATAAMVFELVDDQWVCIARNPEHPEMLARLAIRHIHERRNDRPESD